MNLEDFRNIDPQKTVVVKFGWIVSNDGTTEWADDWMKVRALVSQGSEDEWFITPLTLDGRPSALFFEGHSGTNGVFSSSVTPDVMMVRSLREPQFLRELSLAKASGESVEEFEREDLSAFGKAIYDAITTHEVDEEFVQHMLDLLEG